MVRTRKASARKAPRRWLLREGLVLEHHLSPHGWLGPGLNVVQFTRDRPPQPVIAMAASGFVAGCGRWPAPRHSAGHRHSPRSARVRPLVAPWLGPHETKLLALRPIKLALPFAAPPDTGQMTTDGGRRHSRAAPSNERWRLWS